MEPADGSSADLSGRREAHDSWKSERRQREAEQPTCTEFRKMEERITDMDVEEAVKKLTQAVNQYKKRLSSEDCSQSSAGRQRFYNWNTTHFYPDVHKLDIGILFRHSNDEFNRPHSSRNACEEDDERGYVSTSSSEGQGDDRKRAQKAFARKKMMLIQPPRSHIDNVGATRNGLGVKIDIDLDSRSNSDEDDRDMWHRSPVRLRRIRRQDGRPLSAEINYDAASKKLYIHTLSKKMDTTSGKNGDRAYESAGQRAGKISRRLSSPGSGGSNHVRRFDRKTDKGIGESARKQTNSLKTGSIKSDSPATSHAKTRQRRDFIQKLGKLQGLDFYDETQGRPRTEKTAGKRGDRVDLGSSDLVSSDLVSLRSGHLSRSQEDVCYIEPARMEWQVLGELNDNQPKSICAMDRQIAREWKSNGKNAQSNTSLHQSREQENQPQSKNASGALQSGKSVGWCPRRGSSFENIYDSVGFDANSWTTAQQEIELNERKRQKVPENHFTSGRTKNTDVASELNFPNVRPTSFHCESKAIAEKLRNNSKTNVDHDKVSAMASPVSQPQSGCRSNATGDQQKPRRLLIDAKSLMEEEKQKFEDYKTQYRRQWSGQENVGDDEKGECVDPYIPPDDYVYILRKIHHTRQDAPAHSQPQKPASSGLRVDLHHQPESDGLPLTRSDPELSLLGAKHGSENRRHKNQSTGEEVDEEWSAAKQIPIQLPSEIYLDRYEYNRNMVMPKDGRTSKARDGRNGEARDDRTSEARGGRTSEARDGRTSEARDGRTSEARDGRTSEVTETDSKMSAFQRILRCSDSHHSDPAAVAAASFDGNQIHSRRPDLIPSPMAISSSLSYPTDTKQNKMKETHSREDPLPLSCRVELGPHPNSPDRVPRSQAGLLHKPPKPRKDEFSAGTVGPKQWMYNTTYEPSTPPPTQGPDGHNIFTKTSPVGCTGDGGHFPAEMNFELQGSSPRDVCRLPPPPPPPPPSPPSSTSMNVFRTLPEQYRLSIQEPSSAVTDSLVTKNGILPLYHKESNEGRVKMGPLFPLNPGDKKHAQHYPPPTQTHLTDTALNKPTGDRTDYKSGQRYDKAMVFSITGFHKPVNDSEEMWSPQSPEEEAPYLCDSFAKHPSQDLRDFDVDSLSLPPLNSDSLRQTQWTDAEKRRPFVWNERDKRRPIVDWPDLDNICTAEPEMDVHYQWPFEATFDPREQPAYERKRTDLAGQEAQDDVIDNIFNNGVEQHEIANHEKLGYYLRRPSNSVGSNPAGKPPLNQMDISSCQVRSSEFSQLKGHLSSESGSPQVFYAVQIPNTSADGEGKTDALPYPPRPSSRVPQYNRDPPPSHLQGDSLASVTHNTGDLGNRSNDVDLGIEALQPPPMFPLSKPSNRQSGEFGQLGWPLMPPPPAEEEDRRVKGARSISQPDVWHPISGNVQLRAVLEKKLSQQRQLLSDEKTSEKPDAFQTSSKATVEYEKHINRSQESYKAKKMTTIDSSALDDEDLLLLIPSKLNVATSSSSSSSDHPNRCVALRDEMSNAVLPKQKSALELHLASSFVRPSASAGTTPSEELQRSLKQREPFNIEVDFQPPRTADSPQVFGMSVRLSASQEQLARQAAGPGDADAEEEIPRISISAIKAKLFGENEKQVITGRQLPIHFDHQQSRQQQQQPLVKSNAVKDPPPSVKTGSNAKNRNALENDDRLVDYVSYKDGLKKKRSKIYDELTDFERTYEGLDFDDDAAAAAAAGNNHHIPQKVFSESEFHTDPANVKRLSITNLKLLTESQERLVPNPSLEYTKEWILTGKGPESGYKSTEQQRNPCTNSGKIHPAENTECLANCPRKVIDDMAYRKYGQGSMLSAKSDPDLPFKAVQVGLLPYPTVEPTRNLPMQAPDPYGYQLVEKNSMSQMPIELKKVQIETQINSYKMSPPHFHHPGDQSEEASEPHFVSRNGSSTRPIQPPTPCGTRVSLRQLNRSSSFESSARDTKPETRPLLLPPSGVAKLVELFELSQSAPDLTEAGNLFGDSYTETGNPKAMQKPKKQKTPKDVKLRSENRSRIRLLKVNADSGYVESESDSQSSSGPELQPLTSALAAQETHQMDYNKQDPSSDPPERHEDQKQCLPYKKLSFPGSIQPTFSSCEEVSKKSETPEERMRRLQKLREEWFKKNPEQAEEGTKPMFGFDSGLTKRSTGGDSTQNRNIVTKPCAPVTTTTSRKERRSDFESGNFLPSVNPPTHGCGSLTKPGKSLDSLDSPVNSHENVRVSWQSQNVGNSHASSSGANRGTSTRTEQTIGLDSVRGPEIQKTTINLSLSTPPTLQTKAEQRDSSVLSHVSFPSVQLSNRENQTLLHHQQPDQSFDQSSVGSPAIKASAEHLDTEDKVKDTEKPSPSGFPKERQDRTFQQTSGRGRTITEMKTEKMKVEPWQFEASKRFERSIDQPTKKTFEYESQEFHHKEQVLTDVDVRITKQHMATRAERVFQVERKHAESPTVASKGRPSAFAPASSSFRQLSLIDRLDFSDGEMTDATDVTLDAMVGFNQARPSSPETLDFSDMEMSASAFPSSKHGGDGRVGGGFYTRTTREVMQKNSEGSQKLQTVETITRDAARNTAGGSKQEPLPTREELLAKAQSEMKLYRKDRDKKTEAVEQAEERRRSIKELVDSFEVMTMPFMRSRQRSSEVRMEDVEGAMGEKQRQN